MPLQHSQRHTELDLTTSDSRWLKQFHEPPSSRPMVGSLIPLSSRANRAESLLRRAVPEPVKLKPWSPYTHCHGERNVAGLCSVRAILAENEDEHLSARNRPFVHSSWREQHSSTPANRSATPESECLRRRKGLVVCLDHEDFESPPEESTSGPCQAYRSVRIYWPKEHKSHLFS
jgi:hypothetical protein